MRTWLLDLGTAVVVVPGSRSRSESQVAMRMVFAFARQPQKVRRIKLRR